jgi:hypothetical protein
MHTPLFRPSHTAVTRIEVFLKGHRVTQQSQFQLPIFFDIGALQVANAGASPAPT